MGWLQIRRWLSFLPAAFVVYILLHYLVYQPVIQDSQGNFITAEKVPVRKDETAPPPPPQASRNGSAPKQSSPAAPLPKKESLAPDGKVPQAKSEAPTAPKGEDPSAKKETPSSETRPAPIDTKSPPQKPPDKQTQVIRAQGAAVQPKLSVVKPAPKPAPKPASAAGFAINSLKGKSTIGQKYDKGFTTPHEELCPNNGRDLKVLILITTAPDHEKHRNAVRQTWGHFAMRKDVSMGFMVGRTARPEVQALIDRENERYGDIVEANFVDHYSNLTLKTMSMFEWVKTYCSESKFILKTDDDMYINVPLLLAFINAKKNDKRSMFGRLAKGWKPVRNKKSKYYIDVATYNRIRYPDFLTGPAYLFTNDIVEEMFNKALDTSFFVLEDVLLTGFVGESLGIKRVGDSHFRNERIKLTDTCKLMQSISIHMVKYEEQFDIYKRTLDGKTKCKIG